MAEGAGGGWRSEPERGGAAGLGPAPSPRFGPSREASMFGRGLLVRSGRRLGLSVVGGGGGAGRGGRAIVVMRLLMAAATTQARRAGRR